MHREILAIWFRTHNRKHSTRATIKPLPLSHTHTDTHAGLKWFTRSFSLTQARTCTFTCEIYRMLAPSDLHSYCSSSNSPPRHNLHCQKSRHTQPIMAHFKGLFAQLHLAVQLQITAYWAKWRTVNIPPAECLLWINQYIVRKGSCTGEFTDIQIQAAHTHTQATNTSQHPLDKTIWCAVETTSWSKSRSFEVIKLQEGPLSGQISVGFQQESSTALHCCTGTTQRAVVWISVCRGSFRREMCSEVWIPTVSY